MLGQDWELGVRRHRKPVVLGCVGPLVNMLTFCTAFGVDLLRLRRHFLALCCLVLLTSIIVIQSYSVSVCLLSRVSFSLSLTTTTRAPVPLHWRTSPASGAEHGGRGDDKGQSRRLARHARAQPVAGGGRLRRASRRIHLPLRGATEKHGRRLLQVQRASTPAFYRSACLLQARAREFLGDESEDAQDDTFSGVRGWWRGFEDDYIKDCMSVWMNKYQHEWMDELVEE